MESSPLQIFDLITNADRKKYKSVSGVINAKNPFYRLELLITPETDLEHLKYFVYLKENVPVVLMPFYLKQIIIGNEKTSYSDVSSPWGYFGPLFSKNIETESIINFWETVDNWYKKNNVVTEFIRFSLNNNHINYSGSIVPTLNNVYGSILPKEIQWQNFKKKVRNNIRKAINNKLKFEIFYKTNFNQQSILEFYDIYTNSLKRNNAEKRYFYSLDYFENFIKNNLDCCALAIVKNEDIAISAELLLLYNENIYSFVGGTNSDFFKTRPNDFLKYNVINWARSSGFKYYILGGGQQNDDSLYHYKKSFFPKDKDLTFFTGRKILDSSSYYKLVCQLNSTSNVSKSEAMDISKGFFPKYRLMN